MADDVAGGAGDVAGGAGDVAGGAGDVAGGAGDVAGGAGAEQVLRALWARIDAQDWAGAGDLIDAGATVRYPHTGEVFDRAAYLRLNAEYPGRWHVEVSDVVAAGDRAVSSARLYGGTENHYVASFATVRDGRITELTELWATSAPVPSHLRPAGGV